MHCAAEFVPIVATAPFATSLPVRVTCHIFLLGHGLNKDKQLSHDLLISSNFIASSAAIE
jgi:hypothetical protein